VILATLLCNSRKAEPRKLLQNDGMCACQ
jgi:hypothetical protein